MSSSFSFDKIRFTNKEWSSENKSLQSQLQKKASFSDGIITLLRLRGSLMDALLDLKKEMVYLPDFALMPLEKAKGYERKTIAYSIYHIFRIEDIVAHTLILNDEQVFFKAGFQAKIRSPIITTGNELAGKALIDFSKSLDISSLYDYALAVKARSDAFLKTLSYEQLATAFSEEDKRRLRSSSCVSEDPAASWLIDYWCGKDLLGLLKMPFSRHWIMHIEAAERIEDKIVDNKHKRVAKARKGLNLVGFCGHHCDHCFLSEFCGGCRSDYAVCSFSTCFSNGICPNVTCAKNKHLQGCYDCETLPSCQKGFYGPNVKGSRACKAKALFIHRYGETVYASVLKRAGEEGSQKENQAFEEAIDEATAMAFLEKYHSEI